MAIDLNNIQTDDPEALAAAYAELEKGEAEADPAKTDPATDISTDPAATATPAKDEKQGEEATQAVKQEVSQEGDQEADGILAKDGKNIIPFSTLKSARERAAQAEQLVRDHEAQIAELKAAIAGNQGAKQGESARTTTDTVLEGLTDEDRAILAEDYPTILKAIDAAAANIAALQSQMKPVVEQSQVAVQERERSAAESVQDAIDSVPKLAHIQSSNSEAFDLAKRFDAQLKDLPAWKDKPLQERFSKVAEMVESALGPIELPNRSATPTAADLAAAAKAKAEAAAKATKTSVPTSLSEFAAGEPAATDEQQAAEQMSQLQLAEKFSRMSPDQMDAYFSTL